MFVVIPCHWMVSLGAAKPPSITEKISYKSRFTEEENKKPKESHGHIISDAQHKRINNYIKKLIFDDEITDHREILRLVLEVDYMKVYETHKKGRQILQNKIFKIQQWNRVKRPKKKKLKIMALIEQGKTAKEIVNEIDTGVGYVHELIRLYKSSIGERPE